MPSSRVRFLAGLQPERETVLSWGEGTCGEGREGAGRVISMIEVQDRFMAGIDLEIQEAAAVISPGGVSFIREDEETGPAFFVIERDEFIFPSLP
jgi:hypothetical protein